MSGGLGYSGMTPRTYFEEFTDLQIATLLFCERDEDGRVVPECELAPARARRRKPGEPAEPTGSIESAFDELPSMTDLEIPERCLHDGIPMDFMLMTWQVWRSRGCSTEEILAHWDKDLVPKARRQ